MPDDREQTAPNHVPRFSPEANWRAPRSLSFVAFLFILFGVLGVSDMLLHWLMHGGLYFNLLAILLLFTGRGLLRWQNGWRICAIVISGLIGVGGIFDVFMAGHELIAPPDASWNWTPGSWMGPGEALLLGLAICAFVAWQLHLLNRRDIVWRFKNRDLARHLGDGRRSWNPLHWRFSLQSMFMATIIAAIVMIQLRNDELWHHWHHGHLSWGSGTTAHNIEFGTRTSRLFGGPEVLTYVALSNGEGSQSGFGYVQTNIGGHGINAQLSTHDQKENIRLPGNEQLYEVIDDHIRSRSERVSKDVLDDFVALHPADWSLDALVEHAQWMRQHPHTRRNDIKTVPSSWQTGGGTGD
jgi:hypothetical protein